MLNKHANFLKMLNIDDLTLDETSSCSLQYPVSVFILNAYFNLLGIWIKVVETLFVLIHPRHHESSPENSTLHVCIIYF